MTTATAQKVREAHASGELSHQQILTILSGLMMGMFLASLDQTVVSTAIRTISDDLNGYSLQAWVTTAYLITSTISTPLYGKLSDLYGRKRFFVAGILIFVVGSLLCTFSTSMYMLAVFRAIQGAGAGGLMSLSMAILGDIVPPRERARYQGYILAVFGTSSVLGPVIGGFFADQSRLWFLSGWRWIFLLNVPLGIIAASVVMRTLHLHHERRQARVDWWGAAAIIVGLVPLLTVAEQGRTWGWGSHRSIACYVVGALGVLAFLAVEARMKDDALIPLRIFRSRAIAIAISGGFVVGAGMFGGMTMLPQYLQVVHGASPTRAGLLMLPMVLGMMIAAIASGQLMSRTGRIKVFPIIGIIIMVVALLFLSRISADTRMLYVSLEMFGFGFGLGNTMQPLTLAVQNAVSPREIGMATSAATFFRQIGGTLGVAVFLSVMFNQIPGHMRDNISEFAKSSAFAQAVKDPSLMSNPTNAAFVKALTSGNASSLGSVLDNTETIAKLSPVFAHPLKQAFAQSMATVFLIGAFVCAAGVLIMLFLPNIMLSSQSASARAAAEARGEAGDGAEAPDVAEAPARRRFTEDLVDQAAAEVGGHTMKEMPADADRHRVVPRRALIED